MYNLVFKNIFYLIILLFLGQKYDDDDDFIFDSDSESSYKQQLNLAILLGPSGCGKTSAVYAVANELNANVMQSLIVFTNIITRITCCLMFCLGDRIECFL